MEQSAVEVTGNVCIIEKEGLRCCKSQRLQMCLITAKILSKKKKLKS